MKSTFIAAGLGLGAIFAAGSAAALPIGKLPGVEGGSRAESVAWYCDSRGHCLKVKKSGYVVRSGWEPTCPYGWEWDGWRCERPRAVYVPPRPVYVAPQPVYVAPRPVVVVRQPKPVVVIKQPKPVIKLKIN